MHTPPHTCNRASMLLWNLALPAALMVLTGTVRAANTELDVANGKTDLTAAGSYTQGTAPSTTNDITFTGGTTYSPTTFTSNVSFGIGTLNDLDTTQNLTITNNGSANDILTLSTAQNSVSGTAADLLYVAANGNLTIQNGSHALGLGLASGIVGNFDVGTGATLTVNSIISGSIATTGVGLNKTGAGTLVLNGTNTFGGGGGRKFTLTAGTVDLNNNQALGNTQTAFVIAGGTFDNTSGSAKTINNAEIWNANFAFGGSNNLTLSTGTTVTLGTTSGTTRTVTTNGTATLNIAGSISNGTTATAITKAGTGVLELSGSNSYTGLTTVGAGMLLIGNTAGSATGTGSLTVSGGATLAGAGTSAGTGFNVTGTGTTPTTRANILVGQTSTSSTTTTGSLVLTGAVGTIGKANLSFNLDTTTAGAGTQLNVGATTLTFASGVQSTVLSLNLQGSGNAAANSPYVLIAGTTATGGGGVNDSQYFGLNLGASTGDLATGLSTIILGSGEGGTGNLALELGALSGSYPGGSYLFLYQNTTTGADNIEVMIVPEPSTWALTLGGLFSLILVLRRTRSRQI